MSVIFVNTDNNNIRDKMYDGALAKADAVAAEKKMQDMVIKVVNKNAGFTTNKPSNPKGYSIKLKIAKLISNQHETSCTLTGEVVRYPNTYSVKGSGQSMVSTKFSGSATASGMGKYAVVECVEAIAESMIAKAIPAMRSDFTTW